MSFYFPLGLLGLLGIPVLIIIYIIKSKYTEQTIASTYLWELSEKFLKKRKPISKLTGVLTLILQILAVAAVSFLIAHPVFIKPASANDLYFILDGSASMNMQQSGSTRFEKAQSAINKIIDESLRGSKYTLIFVRDTADVAFEDVSDKAQAKANVDALSAGWSVAECSSAMGIAQDYFDKNRSAVIYLVSDKPYEVTNMTLIDVSGGENNYAFVDYGYQRTVSGVVVTGKVISYKSDAEITVELAYSAVLGGEDIKAAETKVQAKQGEPVEFEIEAEIPQYASLQLRIADPDALGEDNVVILYDEAKTQARKVLVVSDLQDRTYIKNAISGAGKASVEVMNTKNYNADEVKGYGLYVFNGFTPATLPKNAAVWLIDAVDGSGKGSGVSFRDYEEPRDTEGSGSYFTPSYSKGTSAQEKLLLKDILGREIAVRKYAKYGIPRSFTTLMSMDGDALISAGLNENNNRQVVFAFRIGDSNFGMSEDFLILVRNLMDYLFPAVINNTAYRCGDIMAVNVVPGCESITVNSPSGKSTTLDTLGNDVCEVQLNETGTYTIIVKFTGNDDTTLCSFASVPEEESRSEGGGSLILSGEREYEYSDGFYDDLLAFFILLAVLLLADWGVYCYEQYQLR